MKNYLSVLLLSLVLFSCDNQSDMQDEQAEMDEQQQQQQTEDTSSHQASLEQVWATDTTLNTPESVLFDQQNNVFYVSNIGGEDPSEKDDNGFISRLSTNGEIEELEWVTGLHAPKGMGMHENTLYVTDINDLVAINIESGEIENRYTVENSVFLNDVTVSDNGVVYFSDSEDGKIYTLENDTVSEWIADLEGPNGLYISGNELYVATFEGGEFMKFDIENKEKQNIAEGLPSGDGVEYTGREGHWLVSNWNGEVHLVGPEGEKEKILDTKDQDINAADIEFIQRMNLLLVPTFFDNRVVAYRLQM